MYICVLCRRQWYHFRCIYHHDNCVRCTIVQLYNRVNHLSASQPFATSTNEYIRMYISTVAWNKRRRRRWRRNFSYLNIFYTFLYTSVLSLLRQWLDQSGYFLWHNFQCESVPLFARDYSALLLHKRIFSLRHSRRVYALHTYRLLFFDTLTHGSVSWKGGWVTVYIREHFNRVVCTHAQ